MRSIFVQIEKTNDDMTRDSDSMNSMADLLRQRADVCTAHVYEADKTILYTHKQHFATSTATELQTDRHPATCNDYSSRQMIPGDNCRHLLFNLCPTQIGAIFPPFDLAAKYSYTFSIPHHHQHRASQLGAGARGNSRWAHMASMRQIITSAPDGRHKW